MAFSNSSVLIYDNAANVVVSFDAAQSTPYGVVVGAAYEGVTLDYVISRAGFAKALGQFVGGGAISLSSTPIERRDPDGTPTYTGTTSADITISFSFSPVRCFVNIGDASVSSQTIVDEIEDALATQDGCRFLAETNGSTCIQAVLAGQTYLLLGQNYRLRRASAGDVNAAIDAYVISADGVVLDGVNGGIQFLIAQDIAEKVWGALAANHNINGSFGKLLKDTLDAAISSRLAASAVAAAGGSVPSAQQNADAVIVAMNAAPPAVNVQEVNGYSIIGTGTEQDPWGPA
jgi:hypothetical protein